jgi:hypothetical protein
MRFQNLGPKLATLLWAASSLCGQPASDSKTPKAAAFEPAVSFGIRLQTLTGYELAAGILTTNMHHEKFVSYGAQVTFNHASYGVSACFKLGEGSSSGFRALFIRPKYRYLARESHIERYEPWKGGSYGLEIGLNAAGHGAPVSAFLGALRNARTKATEVYVGVGIDY